MVFQAALTRASMIKRAANGRRMSCRATRFTRLSRVPRRPLGAASLSRIASSRAPAWWLDEYFGPVEQFSMQLQDKGGVESSAWGVPILSLPDGRLCCPLAEMWAMAEVFRIARLRHATCPGIDALRQVAWKLSTGQFLVVDDVVALRCCLNALRAFATLQSRSSMIDIIRTAHIKLEMDKREATSQGVLATPTELTSP